MPHFLRNVDDSIVIPETLIYISEKELFSFLSLLGFFRVSFTSQAFRNFSLVAELSLSLSLSFTVISIFVFILFLSYYFYCALVGVSRSYDRSMLEHVGANKSIRCIQMRKEHSLSVQGALSSNWPIF